jgi:RNA polymerase sigma factor (sigma-70 family)|tara:strand:+ start:772 stop:1539 length:768 start_codon:yes stop_codon:yes gene_type:complete
MKKYNIQNYVRYKEDVKTSIANLEGLMWDEYSKGELVVKFLPLVENLARKFSTSDQASGVLSINDLIQCGSEGLIKAVNKIDWEVLNTSEDIEKTLKSFLSKRIKGAIRRRIDINRGDIRIPEHKLNEIRKNPKDKAAVALFFNSMFLSIDKPSSDDEGSESSWAEKIEDESEPYNIQLMNIYLKSLMQKHLDNKEYEVLRLSYGLDCNKHSAKEIAGLLDIKGTRYYVTVSEIKKKAVQTLINNVDHTQVLDYL